MINENWIYLTILITGYGAFLYVKGVVQGRVQPNAVTWAILSLAPLIAGFSMLGQDVSLAGTVYTFLTGLGPLAIFTSILFTKHSRWKLTRFDMMCGILSLAGLMLWVSTGKGEVAIVFSIVADGLAFLPTLVKAWTHPSTEEVRTYGLNFASALLSMLIVSEWTFVHAGFPLYILIVDGLMMVFLLRGTTDQYFIRLRDPRSS